MNDTGRKLKKSRNSSGIKMFPKNKLIIKNSEKYKNKSFYSTYINIVVILKCVCVNILLQYYTTSLHRKFLGTPTPLVFEFTIFGASVIYYYYTAVGRD